MSAPLLGREHLPDRITPQTSVERTAAHAQAQAQAGRRRSTPSALSPSPMPLDEPEDAGRPPRVLLIYTGGTIGMKSGPNGYEPAPNYLASMLRAQPAFHNPMMQSQVPPDFLITPHSIYGRNIAYKILEFSPLLDSSCMSMAEWIKVAETINTHYHSYDAFVVLHGTDTLAYTASALSFMLEDLGKTVIVTGAQIPITEHLNDAATNLLGTLTIAGHFVIPEVCVFFAGRLYRGNRVIKIDSSHVDAFASPNLTPLAEIGTGITIDWGAIFVPPDAVHAFRVCCNLDPHVAVLHFFPGITSAAVGAFLHAPIKGVVLQTFGAGNVFDERCDILALIKAAVKEEIIVVNCTQCVAGSVNTVDATGHALLAAGAVPGYDMTTEAALTKLCYVLGLPNLTYKERCDLMSTSLRGELTIPDKSGRFTLSSPSLLEKVASALMASSKREMEMVSNALLPVLLSSAVSDPANPLPLSRLHELEIEAIRTSNIPAGDVEVSEFRSLRHTQLSYDDSGRTPLHVAARAGHEVAMRALLAYNASVHRADSSGHTALYEAVLSRSLEAVQLLRTVGARLDIAPLALASALCVAAAENDVELLRAWNAAGARMASKTGLGRCAIHIAVLHGREEAALLLEEKSRGIADEPDVTGQTLTSMLAARPEPWAAAMLARLAAAKEESSNPDFFPG